MARLYAGILGPLAFLTCLIRGTTHAGAAASTLWTALGCLWLFAAVGWVLGKIAEQTVEDAVRGRLVADIREKGVRTVFPAGVGKTE